MKRLLLSLIAAGGLAFLASPALAVNPLCGHQYAVLIQGANPTTDSQTGTGDDPGALTNAVGVGVLNLDATCSSASTGEFIFNDGDTQGSGDAGVFVGPAHCYDNFGLLAPISAQDGVPCFDGADHLGGTLSVGAGLGNGSQTLAFTQTNAWLNGHAGTTTTSFSFIVQASTGGATVVGSSTPPATSTTRDVTKPILTLTMQKIGKPLSTVFGVAPEVGDSVVSVSSFGANGSDFVASSISGGGNGSFNGGFDSTVGAVEFFDASNGGGSLTLNANDNLEVSAGTFPSGTNDCAFDITPGNFCSALLNSHCTTGSGNANCVFGGTGSPYCACTGAGTGAVDCTPQPTQSAFADGTSNTIALFSNSATCSLATNTPGVGFSQSTVYWGATDSNTYFTNTAFITGVTATSSGFEGFTPGTGSEGTGITIAQAPAGKLTGAMSPAAETDTGPIFPQTKTATIKLTSTTPATCGVHAALALSSGTQSECSASLVAANAEVAGDTIVNNPATYGINCTCTSKSIAETDTYTLTLSPTKGAAEQDTDCPISITATTFTCKN